MGIETIALAALAGGTVLGAAGSIAQGNQQRDLAEAQAEQAERQAAQERDAAVASAERIRRAGRRQSKEADAAYASSGVSVGVGTPVVVNEAINRDAEEDAYMTILTGKRRGRTLDEEAELHRRAGKTPSGPGTCPPGVRF